ETSRPRAWRGRYLSCVAHRPPYPWNRERLRAVGGSYTSRCCGVSEVELIGEGSGQEKAVKVAAHHIAALPQQTRGDQRVESIMNLGSRPVGTIRKASTVPELAEPPARFE